MTARKVGQVIIAALICALAVAGLDLWRQGYRVYIIHTGSMIPTLPMGAAVIDKPAPPYNQLKPGEIITFRHSGLSSDVVTHRIISLDNGTIQTKGDANKDADGWNIRPDQVEGVQALTVPKLGFLLVFLKQPAGIASVVSTLFALMLLWGLFFPATADSVVRVPVRARHRLDDRLARARLIDQPEFDPQTEFIPVVLAHVAQPSAAPLSVWALAAGVSAHTDNGESVDFAALNTLLESADAAELVDA